MERVGRAFVGVLLFLPLIMVMNWLMFLMSYWTLVVMFGCFAPEGSIEILAGLEFLMMTLYSVVQLGVWIWYGEFAD